MIWVKEAKSVEEIIAIAKEDGVELSVEDAETIYAQVNQSGELSDDDLAMVAGGENGGNSENRNCRKKPCFM